MFAERSKTEWRLGFFAPRSSALRRTIIKSFTSAPLVLLNTSDLRVLFFPLLIWTQLVWQDRLVQTELLDDGYHHGLEESAQNRLCWGISSWLQWDGNGCGGSGEEEWSEKLWWGQVQGEQVMAGWGSASDRRNQILHETDKHRWVLVSGWKCLNCWVETSSSPECSGLNH